MSEYTGRLPEFDNPPVREVILSVEFERMPNWKIAHYGAFWTTIRTDYPRADTQPPLAPSPRNPFAPIAVALSVGDINLARACFINDSGSMQLQVQNDRFLTAWARIAPDQAYPRYATTRPNFERQWERFRKFVRGEGLAEPRPTRCEITYVNHIGEASDWSILQSLEKTFAPWSGRQTEGFLPKPSLASIFTQYTFDDGDLAAVLQPAIRVADQVKLAQLALTARLPLAEASTTEDILQKFDLGRDMDCQGLRRYNYGRNACDLEKKGMME